MQLAAQGESGSAISLRSPVSVRGLHLNLCGFGGYDFRDALKRAEFSHSQLISDLAREERKAVEEKVNQLLSVPRICDVYLRDYAGGTQTVGKFLISTDMVRGEITEARNLLMEKHNLPAVR